MAKNIVIFSDGTGQVGGEGNSTNIHKLFNMIEDRTQQQVAFYDPGLGTDRRKVAGNVGGGGISRNIKQCYRFIFDEYQAGDHIFLFGFSRGAATVRSLSSFIHYFGILPKSRPELIDKAYKIYKKSNDEKREIEAAEFVRKHHTIWTSIKFIGCFDTVAALGLPFKTASALLNGIPGFRHKFHNFRLSQSVENAYHALALDDERKTFHPVLWSSTFESYQTVQQVWFGGMHTDVGGGYEEQNLSDIPLVWMTDKAVKCGLLLYPRHKVLIAEDAEGVMHNSRGTMTTKLFRRKIRSWDEVQHGKAVIHQSVLDRSKDQGNAENSGYHPWILDHDHNIEPWIRYKDQAWRIR
jgi:uncharacterized protein (DUF2235 family)